MTAHARRLPAWLGLGLPLSVSLAVHGGLLLLLLSITLRVSGLERGARRIDPPSVTLSSPAGLDPSEIIAPTRTPDAPAPQASPAPITGQTLRREEPESGAQADVLEDVRRRIDTERAARLDELESLARARAQRDRGAVFAGSRAKRGSRIVYVVDGSGSMVSCMRSVMEELVRSVARLAPGQRFGVVLFRQRAGAPVVEHALGPKLVAASESNKLAVTRWASGVVAGGRSDPIDGLTSALRLEPDVVFFLSRGIERTGGGAWGGGAEVIQSRLDELNPVQPGGARRMAVIKPVQFLDPDPTGVMEVIGLNHDPSADPDFPYMLLTLDDLTEKVARDAEPSPDLGADDATSLGAAAQAIARLSHTGADTRLLYGLATEQDRAIVEQGAAEALRLAQAPSEDVRAPLLLGRATLLLSVASGDNSGLDTARAALSEMRINPDDSAGDAFEISRLVTLAQLDSHTGADSASVLDLARRAWDLAASHPDDALIDPVLVAEAALLPVAGAESEDALIEAGTELVEKLGGPPFERAGVSDPLLVLLAYECVAHAWLDRNQGDVALRALVAALKDRRLGETDARRAVVFPLLARLADDSTRFDRLDPRVALAEAYQRAAEPGAARDAVRLFDLAASRAPELERECAWESGLLLAGLFDQGDRTLAGDAAERLLSVFAMDPASNRGKLAATAALGMLRQSGEGYAAALDRVFALGAPVEPVGYWRVEHGRTLFERDQPIEAIGVLAEMDPRSEHAAQAAAVGAWGAARALESDPPPSRSLQIAEVAIGLAGSLGVEPEPIFLLARARALEALNPALAASRYDELLAIASDVGGEGPVRLGLARSRRASGDDKGAIAALRPILDMDAPPPGAPGVFWEGWAIALETMRARGEPTAAHVLRLRSLDAGLGGPGFRLRIAPGG